MSFVQTIIPGLGSCLQPRCVVLRCGSGALTAGHGGPRPCRQRAGESFAGKSMSQSSGDAGVKASTAFGCNRGDASWCRAPNVAPCERAVWFYTGFTPVPHSRLPDGGEESCRSPRHPTQGFTPVGNWLYPGGESARRHPALIPPLGAANLCT